VTKGGDPWALFTWRMAILGTFYKEDDDLWELFTRRMTIPGHFLPREMFTLGTFPLEVESDPFLPGG
jgi:hypothetical protein